QLGVVFFENGVPRPELEVQSYSWIGNRGNSAVLANFTLTLAPTSVEPGLWGHLAAGRIFPTVVVHLRDANGREYQAYTLSTVTISIFSTGSSAGSAPTDTIYLQFVAVTESATPLTGPANTAQYNLASKASGGVG